MPPSLPEPLEPEMVEPLFDALLSNADTLLSAALSLLEKEYVALARSVAILGLEESGKAIAIFERRVEMAHEPEGSPFVDERLRKLWGWHRLKLQRVHSFLVQELYWFGNPNQTFGIEIEPEAYLETIAKWAEDDDLHKQRGFYVDVTTAGQILTPSDDVDREEVEDVIMHVHQIGWQLRLGEHIEAKRQDEQQREYLPAGEETLESLRRAYEAAGWTADRLEAAIAFAGEPTFGTPLNNQAYLLRLPAEGTPPLANLGKPGHEAETRELMRIMATLDDSDQEAPPNVGGEAQ